MSENKPTDRERAPVPPGDLWTEWLADLKRWIGSPPTFTRADFDAAARAVYVEGHRGPPNMTPEKWAVLTGGALWTEFVELHGWQIMHTAEAIARAREGAASDAGASAWRKEAPKPADVRRFGAHWWNKTEKGRPHIVCLEIDGVDDDEEFVIASDGITEAEWRGEWAPCTPPAPPTASATAVSVEGKTVATGRVVSVGEKRIGIAFRTLNGIGVGDEVRIVVTPLDGGEGR